jgi:hypothetical protein
MPPNLLKRMFKKVLADDGAAQPPDAGAAVNVEELIAQVRKEEKDKLYPRLAKAEEESKRLTKELSNALIREAGLKAEIEAAKAKEGGEGELAALKSKAETLKSQNEELAGENKRLLGEIAGEGALREKIRSEIEAEYGVRLYREKMLAEHKDTILSVFADEVAGATKEEIDAAIQKAEEKTAKIKKDLGIGEAGGQSGEEPPAKPAPIRKAAPAAKPRTDKIDIEELRTVDVRSPEYAALRKKLGLDRDVS